jgi:hypothetical protein
MTRGRIWALLPFIALTACNMVYSEQPMFVDADRASLSPKEGVWLAEVEDCTFDSSQPESRWPQCAVWVIVRQSGRDLLVTDGKGQTESIGALFASGSPMIVQGRWVDDVKQPAMAHYAFYGLEPLGLEPDHRYAAALTWLVECGVKDAGSSEIKSFPGIGPECRPSSKDSIRAAAISSRRAEQLMRWRWLRVEAP